MFSACFSCAWRELFWGGDAPGDGAYFFDKGENVAHRALKRFFVDGVFPRGQMTDD